MRWSRFRFVFAAWVTALLLAVLIVMAATKPERAVELAFFFTASAAWCAFAAAEDAA